MPDRPKDLFLLAGMPDHVMNGQDEFPTAEQRRQSGDPPVGTFLDMDNLGPGSPDLSINPDDLEDILQAPLPEREHLPADPRVQAVIQEFPDIGLPGAGCDFIIMVPRDKHDLGLIG